MFSKSKTSQHDLSRPTLRRLSGAALLPAISLFLLAGCGGGGGNGNPGGGGTTGTTGTGTGTTGTGTGGGGGNSPFAGSYQGVSLNTSGQFSPDAGTTVSTISPSGVVSVSTVDFSGDGSTSSAVGTISSTGAVIVHGLVDPTQTISGSASLNSTTHVFTISYTESNGTKGVTTLGVAPTASPLAGSYSGTFSNSTEQFPVTLTISSSGTVTGTLGTLAVANQGFAFSGYVDTNGNLYLADKSGGVPENILGTLTLNGTLLTGPAHSSAADGSSSAGTLSLTKH